jgi:hypothetical protein
MKIGEAHRTQSSYCANTNGTPMHPALLVMVDLTGKKIIGAQCLVSMPIGGEGHRCANILAYRCPPRHYYWRTDGFTSPIGRQNKRSKKKRRTKQFSAPHLFQANRLLTELYKQETEIR